MKLVVNRCYGGFCLSRAAYAELGIAWDGYGFAEELGRDNAALVAAVEKLGEQASGEYADLKIVQIPDGTDWTIEEYDGLEWVAEKHRTWS